MGKYKLTNDLNKSDFNWLERDYKKGEIVYKYFSATYGCISSGIAVTEVENEHPFFEIPQGSFKLID
jgi:hypothetical protein